MRESSINMDQFTLDDLFRERPSLTGLKGWQRAPLVMERPTLARYLLGEVACGRSELVAGRSTAEVPVPVMRQFEFLTERQDGMERFYEDSAAVGLAVSMVRIGKTIIGQSRTLGTTQDGFIIPSATIGHEVTAQTYETPEYAHNVFKGAQNSAIYLGRQLTEHLAVA